jgi:hypothetical protein
MIPFIQSIKNREIYNQKVDQWLPGLGVKLDSRDGYTLL